MFKIDRSQNRLEPLGERAFAKLQLRERNHLQEWLAQMPSAFGEDLLIIQKEFDGFDGTRERLDLLALDKEGRLVLIENKLDDSGRDVVWQVIKYAAYASTLTKTQIVDIFQLYLDRYKDGGNAAELICDFTGADDLEEVVLNSGNSQRIIMVASSFRKEVTATALWMLGHGIATQCFKATLCAYGDDLLLDVRQIIPVPDAEEFMIGMSSKDNDEKTAVGAKKARHGIREAYWKQVLEAMRQNGISLYANISPSQDHWLSAGSGVSGCQYTLIFGKAEARVELSLARASAEENKLLFDALAARKAGIEATFGAALTWKRLDEKKASRIEFSKNFDGYNQENWPEIVAWHVKHMTQLETALSGPLREVRSKLSGV